MTDFWLHFQRTYLYLILYLTYWLQMKKSVVGIKEFLKQYKTPLEERLEQEGVRRSITEKWEKIYNPLAV